MGLVFYANLVGLRRLDRTVVHCIALLYSKGIVFFISRICPTLNCFDFLVQDNVDGEKANSKRSRKKKVMNLLLLLVLQDRYYFDESVCSIFGHFFIGRDIFVC